MDALSGLLLSYRRGASGAAEALHDYCEEEGIVMLEVGKCYLIRTLTMYYTGRVIESSPLLTVLEEAAWIPDTGRYGECLAKGKPAEVEPYPGKVTINTQHITDAAEWHHRLPREAK